jgi:hypothetical protein
MRIVYQRCCGLDVHKNSITACLTPIDDDGEFRTYKREFGGLPHQGYLSYGPVQTLDCAKGKKRWSRGKHAVCITPRPGSRTPQIRQKMSIHSEQHAPESFGKFYVPVQRSGEALSSRRCLA